MAFGDSRHWPSDPRSRKPWFISARSSSASVRASTAAWSPSCRASASRSTSSIVAPGVALRQLFGELLEFGDVGQRLGAFAHAQRVVAGELRGTVPVLPRPRRLQVAVEPVERIHQLWRAECLLRQGIQLGALVGGQAVAETLSRRGPLGQRVEQLLDVLRVLREVLAVLAHEVLEVIRGVLPARMLVQQVIQVVEHLVDGLAVLVGGVLQRLLHPREALVEHLPAEQILDLVVLLPRLGASPVVVRQLLHGLGRRRRQRLDLQLGEPGVVVEGAGQLLALGQHGLVEQLLDLLQGAVKVVAVQQLPPSAVGLGGEPVRPAHVLGARGAAARTAPGAATCPP